MRCDEETLVAAAAILRGLAKDIPPSDPVPFTSHKSNSLSNGFDVTKITLPGQESDGKAVLEDELSALVRRIHAIEAYVVSRQIISP
jgi:osomolarity two-component system sensor histidine kinase NIK1